MGIYLTVASSIIFAVSTALLFFRHKATRMQLEETGMRLAILEHDEIDLLAKINKMQVEQDSLLVKKTEAETKLQSLREQFAKLEIEKNTIAKDREIAIAEKNQHQLESELVQQRIETITQEMEDWKKTKEQHIEITKASMLEVSNQLSNKLLDDHKRETETAKKENEKVVKETTEELHKKFQNVFESMSTLTDKVNKSTNTTDLIRNSLLSPSGAGNLSEITLSNIFKASNLIENIDYQMQYHVAASEDAGRLRPDAMVFLPNKNALVIDSKASKFFVEIEQANEDDKVMLSESLKKTMNKHLNDLISRDYKQAVERQLSDVTATTLMFLPTEAALEKLRAIDPNFVEKAWKERIFPVGPTGLLNLLLQSRLLISNAKQEKNYELILNEVRDLINSVVKLNELASAMGKGLSGVFKKYDEFAASFNRNFLSKAKRIDKLGANVPKIKEVKQLERFSIDARDYKQIDAEFEEESAAEVKELEAV
jgi:DNA recombination protein RmuC